MIRVEDLAVTFAKGSPLEKMALAGVSLMMEPGEFVTVIGSNGAGKSTLLNAIAGDFPPTRGRIVIGDVDVSRQPTAKRSSRVARVFQDPLAGSCGDLTIEENLAIAAARGTRRGLSSALTVDRRALFRDRLAALGLGLEGRLRDRMAMLSGGQRQALALVMATLADSNVLLLDEHTAALDPGMAEFVLRLTAKTVTEHHLTTLMVTHSMRQALDLGTRTIMLHEGRIILDVGGDERKGLGVEDLVEMFRRQRGETLDEDELLL
ncbi:ABC transporter ATP-binding protein [Bauldia sp.]|uniref:ABC transporter ATP-binding protein n=1 Tax=Bauldia sp. TaxID=2575872 RepID=UPI003BA85D16